MIFIFKTNSLILIQFAVELSNTVVTNLQELLIKAAKNEERISFETLFISIFFRYTYINNI